MGAVGVIALASPTLLRAEKTSVVRRITSSFRLHEWRDNFDSLGKGILLSDTNRVGVDVDFDAVHVT